MKWLYSGYAVAVSIALLLALRVVDPTPLQSLRGQVFDSYQQLDEIQHSENVVILNIGEKSLAKYGQYPFPRQYYAQMVIDLATKNSGVTGWTIMFPEEDRFQGDESFAGIMQQNVMNIPGARKNPVNVNVLSQTPSVKGPWSVCNKNNCLSKAESAKCVTLCAKLSRTKSMTPPP